MPLYSAKSALPKAKRSVPKVSVYSDKLTASGSFSNRQWVSSGASSGASNSISYGGGEVRILSGASGRHCLCHFDCMRDQYPTYNASKTYSVGDIVYGGYAGHGLYSKTASSLAGLAPVYTHATTAQDANGWTRYRPGSRTIGDGKSLNISLKLKMDRTGYTMTASNAVRIGLFRGVGEYLNNDNHGVSNAIFNGYSGYMFGFGPANTKILKRTSTANPPLLSTTTAVWTELSSQSISGFGSQDEYDVSLCLKQVSGALSLTSSVTGAGYSSAASYTDSSSPCLTFDTIAFYTTSNNVTSMAVSNPVITYVGNSQPLPSCSDATAQVLMTGANAIWPHGPRLLSPIGYAPYGLETYQYGDEVVRYETGVWIYANNAGIGEIARVYSYASRPWLATWPNFSAEKVCV